MGCNTQPVCCGRSPIENKSGEIMIHAIRTALIILLVLLPTQLIAGSSVSGTFQTTAPDTLKIQLSIPAPPPMAFIVQVRIPKGAKVISSSPSPSGKAKDASSVKWLFKHKPAGKTAITMRLSKKINKNKIQGEIRYRHPENNDMIKKAIKW